MWLDSSWLRSMGSLFLSKSATLTPCSTLTQEQRTHRSQPTRIQPHRKCKAKSKTQFEPESDSAIGQHLLESNQCARNYSDSQFKILTTARSQFHLSLLEAVYISRKKENRFVQAKAVRIHSTTVSVRSSLLALDRLRFSLLFCNPLETHFSLLQSAFLLTAECISPYCRVHFSLLQNAFLLTAECISPYCIWSLKDPAHHIPNQTEIATEEFCPKSLLRKQNEIDLIESHFQILHHLKIVHFALNRT